MEDSGVFASFEVQAFSTTRHVKVLGETLGHLRSAIKLQFDIPSFEQKIVYTHARDGKDEFIELQGDDLVKLKEKLGLMDSRMLSLSRQVDPRYKMEKETAFLEALVACRFVEAKDILQSSGFSIDPNCVHKYRIASHGRFGSFGSMRYANPALTVAIQAGSETRLNINVNINVNAGSEMSNEKELSEVVELLIQKGADVNGTGEETEDCESGGAPTAYDKTPLCAAVQRGSPTLVKILLDARANPDHTHRYGGCCIGPGQDVMKPENWLGSVSEGFVHPLSHQRFRGNPRRQYMDEILALLHKLPRESVLLQPGRIGIKIDTTYKEFGEDQGRIQVAVLTHVAPDSQVSRHGVEVGWRVGLVAGKPYSAERLKTFIDGQESYTVTFFQDKEADESFPDIETRVILQDKSPELMKDMYTTI